MPIPLRFLPVVERELRVASRRRGTFAVRAIAVAIALAAVTLVFLSQPVHPRNSIAQQSQSLFVTLTVLAFLYALLSGVMTTADCISEEKREGTLGLLFLTDLRGFDVIAGKGLASSLRAVSALVALLPLTAIPLLMGGVDAAAVVASAAVLLNTLFLSLAMGLFASAVVSDARRAAGLTLSLLLVQILLLPLGWGILLEYLPRSWVGGTTTTPGGWGGPGMQFVLSLDPAVALGMAWRMGAASAVPAEDFWRALAWQHGLVWVFVGLACVILPRNWRDPVDAQRVGGRAGSGNRAARTRRGWLEEDPFVWLVLRERRSTVGLWAGLAVIAGVWAWGYWQLKEEWMDPMVVLVTLFFAALWLKNGVSTAACRALYEQRRSGALELVLCTPTTGLRMAAGIVRGLRRWITLPVGVVLLVSAVALVVAARSPRGGAELQEVLALAGVGTGVMILDLWTLMWAGLWWGLSSSRFSRAHGITVAVVLALPWVLFFVTMILAGILVDALDLSGLPEPTLSMILGWWAILSVAVDGWVLRRSRSRLVAGLRDLALHNHGEGAEGRPAVGTPGSMPPGAPRHEF